MKHLQTILLLIAALVGGCGSFLPADNGGEDAGMDGHVIGRISPDGGVTSNDASADDADVGDASVIADAKSVTAASVLTGSASATASLHEESDGVVLDLTVTSAPPGQHGVRVLDAIACDGSLGHWNPTNASHGLPSASVHHTGDGGNITVMTNGMGTLRVLFPGANLRESDVMSLLGHALTLAQATDDGTGTTGNAGPSIACGVVVLD